MRSMLKNLKIGRVVHMAENGLEALKILHVNSIDLAIVDWNMPVMNGAQMLEAVRNNKALRDIPVLMVTGESEKDIVLEAAEIEVEGYLLKPLTPAVLEEKIKTIIHQVNFPEEATLHVRKARHLEEKKDIDTAIKHMERAVQLKPGASRLLRNLGLLYQKNGDEKSMEEYLTIAVSVNAWSDTTKSAYSSWSPTASTQTSTFTQTRSYTQNQSRTWTYKAGSSTIKTRLHTQALSVKSEARSVTVS